ncbi:MAG: flagellar assembly protein FliW [Desulfobacterota bacterium]|nr:flagellar assembly protein FliW [Thermodesulfobacteriota bacterium]
MKIKTSRFGEIDIDPSRIITFTEGILGFPDDLRYVLLEREGNSPFTWLQSLDNPELAFVLVDPLSFLPDYRVEISSEDADALGIDNPQHSAVLCIVTISDGGATVTANLLGPIVINPSTMRARQVVLVNTQYSVQYDLLAAAPRTRAAGAP